MANLYNISEETKTAANVSTWLQPGKHDNLKLVDVKQGVSKNGKNFIAFYVENTQGDKVSCTKFEDTFKVPFDQLSTKEQENAIYFSNKKNSIIKQIVEVFKPNCNIQASSFKELIEKTIAFLGDSYKDVPIRLKVVYDNKGWATFGESDRSVFIEPMTVSEEDSKIRILVSDQMTRPAQPDKDANIETIPIEQNVLETISTEDPLF